MAWAYPQKEDALRYLLLRQDFKCIHCQFDYRPFLEAIIDRDKRVLGSQLWDIDKLPWHYFKRLKDKVPQENKPEIDHIIPIYKGGQSLGLDNTCCICYRCHKVKTSKDLSGKRIKNVEP